MKYLLPLIAVPVLSSFLASTTMAEIKQEKVEYDLPTGDSATGVLVYDDMDTDDARLGVLVIPEWWGLTDYPVMRAKQLADDGYVAFVADMYGNGKTTDDPKEAGQWSGAAKKAGLAKLADAGLAAFVNTGKVDADHIAAIGFCFGGSTVADMIKNKSHIVSAVSFHGGLGPGVAPTEKGDYAPLLVCHGGADPTVKPEAFGKFVTESIAAGVPLSVVSFPGVVHAFTNPNATKLAEANPDMKGMIAYDEKASKTSFEIMGEFLEMTLGEPDHDEGHDADNDAMGHHDDDDDHGGNHDGDHDDDMQ